MPGSSRRGLFLSRAVPFFASVALLLWAATGEDLFPPPPRPLRLAVHDWVGYSPFLHAADLGLIDPDRVVMKRLSSAPAGTIGLDAGALDAVALTLDEALRLIEERRDMRIVLVVDESAGADAIVARADIPDIAALRGRRVAAEADSTSQFLLSRALELNGVALADVDLVPVPVDRQLDKWRQGDFDAVATFDPVLGLLQDAGAKVLFDSRQVPGEIVDVLVVRRDVLDTRSDDLRHLLHGWFAVLELDRAPGSQAEAALARKAGESLPDTRRSLAGIHFPNRAEIRPMLTGASPLLLAKAIRIQKWMKQHGLVAGDSDPSVLFGPDVDALYEDEP